MKKFISYLFLCSCVYAAHGQQVMTPELLWKLGRVSPVGLSKDGRSLVYSVSTPNVEENKSKRATYVIPLEGGTPVQVSSGDSITGNKNISPDGQHILFDQEVKINKVKGSDIYADLPKANAYVYTSLDYRHWDQWNDGSFSHVFVADYNNGQKNNEKDLMPDEPFYTPQRPFGGDEDYIWSPDSKSVIYVSKKKAGTAYARSTNTDLYRYDLQSVSTTNLTPGMMGYDVNPAFSRDGKLAWLSMRREGYESDKQDVVIRETLTGKTINLTKDKDIYVSGFRWSNDGKSIYLWVPQKATEQLFEVSLTAPYTLRQITKGDYQVSSIIGETNNELIVTRVDINHATEVFGVNKTSGAFRQITHVNDAVYNTITPVTYERRSVLTADGKQMPTWVVFPPNFDKNKKYPTLLFCLGGPQGTTPFYSIRWNLQLMASEGYIVVAPDRRGVFGDGTKWTEQVSKDWGGLVMKDYLAAIDNVSKEPYVDKKRLGCVGASFGGFSVFMLAGIHNNRFKSFIAHDGVFDFRSEYGTTDEIFFSDWEMGGAYWDKTNAVAQRSFSQSPSNFVQKWNTPIMIVQGGRDYRCPIEQGLQAFQAAQLKGIKSKLLYLPDENHWVLGAQDAQVWQREFFKWLEETLK